MITAEQIVKAFADAPLPTALEIQKYSAGYADGEEVFGDLLANHTPGTFFADCTYIALWPSPSTSLIVTPSLLHILADKSKWVHYRVQLRFLLEPMQSLDRNFYLAHFMFTRIKRSSLGDVWIGLQMTLNSGLSLTTKSC